MPTREEKEKKVKEAVSRCLILDQEDREFWLGHLSILPEPVLQEVLRIVDEKNAVIDRYIEEALKNDPDRKYLAELKMRIKKIKEEAFAMDEKKEKGQAEQNLSKLLKDL